MNILILGGTGSLGRALIERLVVMPRAELAVHKLRVLSRDEHKQAELKRAFPGVECVLGDIRDYSSVRPHFNNMQLVFHVAALKHVDVMEANIMECVKTNVLGTEVAARCAIEAQVTRFLFSSTDKAIDPINAYGYSKALAEKHLLSLNADNHTKFSVYRWGNVLGSKGSVIPHFIKTLRKGYVEITHPDMTRFWLTIESAVNYMLTTYKFPNLTGTMLIDNMKAASVTRVIEALALIMKIPEYKIKYLGLRPGEKLHESLVSSHEPGHINSKTCIQLSDEELIALLEPLVDLYG